MWGGRREDGTYPQAVTDDEPTPARGPRLHIGAWDLASMIILLVALIAGMTGGAVLFGWGGALIVLWATALPVALLIGLGD